MKVGDIVRYTQGAKGSDWERLRGRVTEVQKIKKDDQMVTVTIINSPTVSWMRLHSSDFAKIPHDQLVKEGLCS